MPKQNYKVLITTSGVGQRLGELTKYTNQSLVRLLKKPILSHIVESYPKDIEIVVTLGYFGNLVREFLLLAYPERKFTFVKVDKYQGEGSSQGYSMLQARKFLQCPFIFHAGDTVVMEKIPTPLEKNWCGGFKGAASDDYASFIELDDKVLGFNWKGAADFDYLYIGLAGIKDYEKFWQALSKAYKENPKNQSLGDVPVMGQLVKEGWEIVPKEFRTWLDIGNVESLNNARRALGDYLINLDKADESIYILDHKVIKFFANSKSIIGRVKRAAVLKGLTPKILSHTKHFYSYQFVEGRLFSRVVTPKDFREFLTWAEKNLWKRAKETSEKEFKKICLDFYKKKTLKRLAEFHDLTGIKDEAVIINGEEVPPVSEILKKMDFNWLAEGEQKLIHGDLVLDNVIRTKDSYILLDWRQDFGRLQKAGDFYYDLAKLNHNLTVNHDTVFNNDFTVKVRGKNVICDIRRSNILVECQRILWEVIESKKWDLKKVKVLTTLAWLNMAPLHHRPYSFFLYYFGKLNLWKSLKEQ